jgi:dihydroorotate dehydrogenase (NAD+) catalytic subunit
MVNSLAINIAGLKLKNPVLAASGTFGYGQEYKEFLDLNSLGAIVTKSITVEPCQGNPAPRICETTAGMLNAIGLQNEGLDDFIENRLPELQQSNAKIVASIAGHSREQYKELAKRLDKTDVDAIEINISCPNVEHKGKARLFAQDPDATREIVRTVKRQTSKPVIAKLSPNVTDITVMAQAAQKAGADALSLINTLIGMDIDIAGRRPRLGNITGGLSGPAIKPIALRMVWETYNAVTIPIIGIGGIVNAEDALAFFLCGATAVQIGTANFIDPCATTRIIDDLQDYMKKNNVKSLKTLIGKLRI